MKSGVVACIALLLCLFCAISRAEVPEKPTPAEQAREGWRLLERDMPAEALEMFEAALKAAPDLIDAHRGCQDVMKALGRDHADLLRRYRGKAEKNPRSAAACYLYARLLDDAEEEKEWLEKALENDEKFPWAHYGMARLLMSGERQDVKGAERHLKRAIELQPDMVHAYKALALLYIGDARPEEAKEVYLRAAGKFPGEPFPHFSLAGICLSRKKYGEALKHINKAVEIRNDVPDYHIRKAEILHGQGKREEAARALRHILDELEPTRQDSIDAYEISAKIATPKWDMNEADWELYNMAIARLGAGNLDGAQSRLAKLLERKGGVALLYYQVGRLYQHKGNMPEAMAFLEKAINLEPDYAEPYYLMARIHYGMSLREKDEKKAGKNRGLSEKFALHVLSLHPFYPFPYRLLGQIYHDRGEYEKALKYATYFYKIRHNYSEIRFLLIDEVRIKDDVKPEAEFKVETFNVKVYPGRRPLGRRRYIILRFNIYKGDEIYMRLFAEVRTSRDGETGEIETRYYLCQVLDDANTTHDGFMSDEGPPSATDYELAIREVLALEALGD